LAGLTARGNVDIVVFLDGDYSDYPEDMETLIAPILRGDADFVLGSRATGRAEQGALTPVQRFGNALACGLIRLIWRVRYTDLGPFRAITTISLDQLNMADRGFGWTVEMQVKAARHGLRTLEIPVRYRQRVGRSKISGTLSGSVRAGIKILTVIARQAIG